ncbi:MAG: glycosyltransferase family 2 protein [Acidimicrobiales bacterium]
MAERSPPCVVVIVPVRNRRDLLAALLDALDAQTFTDFEVVIVDDGSTDGTGPVAANRRVAGRPVRVLRRGGEGAVAARRDGVAASHAPYLAFTDSDCVPDPGWLAAGVAALERGADLVNGCTRPARPLRPLERSVYSGEEGLYPTCNVFYRREAFVRAGGFDSSAADRLGFRHNPRARGLGFGEDTLLAWRLIRAGGRVRYAPDAFVHHHVFPPNLVESLSRGWMAAAFPALVREVPELRSVLLRRHFLLGPRSRVPVYATVAALVTRRPAVVAAAAGWWVVTRARDVRRAPVRWPWKLAALPLEMVLDVATSAALVIGSVRARTVVL